MALEVIGFSGRPVACATGVRPALVRDSNTRLTRVEGSSLEWTADQLEEASSQRQVSLLAAEHFLPHQQGRSLVYAHLDLFKTTDFAQPLDRSNFQFVPSLQAWIAYLADADVLGRWRKWAEHLLTAGSKCLSAESNPDRHAAALRAAQLARACTVSVELRDLRFRVFAMTLAARRLLNKPDAALLEDAALDLPAEDVRKLSAEAIALTGTPQPRVPRPYVDTRPLRGCPRLEIP